MLHPIQRAADSAMPSIELDLTGFCCHVRLEGSIHAAMLGNVLQRIEATNGKSGQIGGTQRGGFDAGRAENRQTENIGLELQK